MIQLRQLSGNFNFKMFMASLQNQSWTFLLHCLIRLQLNWPTEHMFSSACSFQINFCNLSKVPRLSYLILLLLKRYLFLTSSTCVRRNATSPLVQQVDIVGYRNMITLRYLGILGDLYRLLSHAVVVCLWCDCYWMQLNLEFWIVDTQVLLLQSSNKCDLTNISSMITRCLVCWRSYSPSPSMTSKPSSQLSLERSVNREDAVLLHNVNDKAFVYLVAGIHHWPRVSTAASCWRQWNQPRI